MFRQAFLLCLQSVPSSPRPRRPSDPSVQSLFPLQIQSAVTKWKLLSPSVWEYSRGSGCYVPLWHFSLCPCGQLMTTRILFPSLTEPLAGDFFLLRKLKENSRTKTRIMLGIMKPVGEPLPQQRWWRWNSHRAPGAKIIERDDMQGEVSQFWLEIQNRFQFIRIKRQCLRQKKPFKGDTASSPAACSCAFTFVQEDNQPTGTKWLRERRRGFRDP